MTNTEQSIFLTFPADEAWVGLAQAAAEHGGRVFGLDSSKIPYLVNGAEELLLFLAAADAGDLRMSVHSGATSVMVDFSFSFSEMDFSALNLVTKAVDDGLEDWGAMSLLLASRMTDGFRIGVEDRLMRISLWVDRMYPEPEMMPVKHVPVNGHPTMSLMEDADVLYEACSGIAGLYPEHMVPMWCASPGRMADMIRAGELFVIGAQDENGRLCGVICWEKRSEQSVTFYGPYDFSEDHLMGGELLTAFLEVLGRTQVRTVFSSLATEPLGIYGFELLAEIPYALKESGEPVLFPAWERQMQEDFGAAVWVHPSFSSFLRGQYDFLDLARDLRQVSDLGESVKASSVIGARLRPQLSEVFLYPELNGEDVADNLARHVSNLIGAGYRNIFFEMDLSKGWHAAMGGHLEACGFKPRMVLPHGGRSDILIFQYVQS